MTVPGITTRGVCSESYPGPQETVWMINSCSSRACSWIGQALAQAGEAASEREVASPLPFSLGFCHVFSRATATARRWSGSVLKWRAVKGHSAEEASRKPRAKENADLGNKESAAGRRFQLGSVVSAVPHGPLSGGQGHPYSHRPSRVGRGENDAAGGAGPGGAGLVVCGASTEWERVQNNLGFRSRGGGEAVCDIQREGGRNPL